MFALNSLPADPTTCRDRPCFTGVVCTDVPLNIDTIDLENTREIKLYECGPCPPGFFGVDGINCFGKSHKYFYQHFVTPRF